MTGCPGEIGLGFEALFDLPGAGVSRGERDLSLQGAVAAGWCHPDPLVRAMGAVNTVIFRGRGRRGTTPTIPAFIAAYRAGRGAMRRPGPVLMIGTGGVGRAVAFGLLALGVAELRLADRDLRQGRGAGARPARRAARAGGDGQRTGRGAGPRGAEGLVNCTPSAWWGMTARPCPARPWPAPAWAFDAVYTPADTQFLHRCRRRRRAPISGWELFFWQGVHAWARFSGLPLDLARLRADLPPGVS
jgi:shikimate dehydrogenase